MRGEKQFHEYAMHSTLVSSVRSGSKALQAQLQLCGALASRGCSRTLVGGQNPPVAMGETRQIECRTS